MTRAPDFARISLSSARWLLPWIAVLFVSATLAYAVDSAVHGGASASDRQPEVQAAASTDERGAAAVLEQSSTSRRMLYVGLNTWIPAEPTANSSSGGTFGVMSTTTPASTGHASPDGCCTWD